MEFKKNQIVELYIDDIGNEGEGIGHIDGYALFLKDAVIGDKVRAKIIKTKKNYGFARVEEVIEASKDRVSPRCSKARQCGGCTLQHLAYEKQLEYKFNKVKNCLERIGGLENIEENDTMARDIGLLHKAVKLVPPISIKETVDFSMVLDELWVVTQEEMNFLTEAANMEEFARRNKDIAFVRTPILYKEHTTHHVLVMEYIDGYPIDDKISLQENGYDLHEIGTKLIDNYIKQVMEDGFFHADPHPGNLRIRGGKIVWLDMGMMGRLTPRDKSLIAKAVKAIARGNNSELVDVILALGIFHGKPNRIRLYTDIEGLMTRYGTMDIGSIDIAALLTELIEIMSANELAMPAQLTLLARGMTTIEGVIADLSPQVNIVEVASGRISASFWENVNWKEELKNEGSQLYRSINRAMDIPVLMADLLQSYRNNETRIKLDLHATEDLSQMLEKLVSKMVMGLVIAALLLASSILCTTQMQPHLFGIPALGFLGYIMALGLAGYLVWEHFKNKNK